MGNLDKVSHGQRIRSLPADDWNSFVDAARAHRAGQLDEQHEGELPELSPVVVLVKNTTGANLPRYSILGIEGPVSDPQNQPDEFRQQIVLVGVTPTESHCGRCVILKDDIPDGFVSEAVIAGACLARVLVMQGQEEFPFANILSGDTSVLSARVIGGARILWRESGTGVKWAVPEKSWGTKLSPNCGCSHGTEEGVEGRCPVQRAIRKEAQRGHLRTSSP